MKTLAFIFLIQLTFPISAEKAKKSILNNKKISKIIHRKYRYKDADVNITNDLILVGNPTKIDPYYFFEIRQFQDKINHSSNLYWLKVNAKNGKVYFYNADEKKLLKINSL